MFWNCLLNENVKHFNCFSQKTPNCFAIIEQLHLIFAKIARSGHPEEDSFVHLMINNK